MKPFIRWVGGKRKHIPQIKKLMPKDFNLYFEPFVGGGAVLFALQPKKAYINDINEELMTAYAELSHKSTYEKIKESLLVMNELKSKEHYLHIRSLDPKELYSVDLVSRFIYLNRLCFNGLYRLNKNGQFNVIYDNNKLRESYNVWDENTMSNVHEYLSKASIVKYNTGDYLHFMNIAMNDSFMFVDPPYDSYEEQDNFNRYGNTSFNRIDQIKLANKIWELTERGVKIMIFNHNTPLIRELYKGMTFHNVEQKLRLTQKGAEEIIITNY